MVILTPNVYIVSVQTADYHVQTKLVVVEQVFQVLPSLNVFPVLVVYL